jgi:hypothetical protein
MNLSQSSSQSTHATSEIAESRFWSASAKAEALMERYNELFGRIVRILLGEGYSFAEACDQVLSTGRLDPQTTVDDFDQIGEEIDREGLLGFKAYNAINRLQRQYADKLQEGSDAALPGANFLHLFNPLLQALKDLGSSARPIDVRNHVARILWLLDRERYKLLEVETPRFNHLLLRAQFYLVQAGYLGSSYGGNWILTEKGQSMTTLNLEEVLDIFKRVHAELTKTTEKQYAPAPAYDTEEEFLQGGKKVATERV